VQANTRPVQDGNAAGIRARLDRYVSDVLALPYAEQLADLSIFQIAIRVGRQIEREALGLPPLRPAPHLTLVTGPDGRP
jgi:hypothetical protein